MAIILTIIALLIGYSGYEKIVGDPAELEVPGQLALWAAIISIVAKEAMFWYTRNAAQKINSGALMAEAWHHRSDAMSSVGAFIGILGARMGYPILDPIASLVICVMILYAAYEVFKDSMDKMVDRSCDEETATAMEELVSRVPGVEHLTVCTAVFSAAVSTLILKSASRITLPCCRHITSQKWSTPPLKQTFRW